MSTLVFALMGIMAGLLVTSPIVVLILAYLDMSFTFKEPGKIKAIMRGKEPVGFVCLLPDGEWLIKNKEELKAYNDSLQPNLPKAKLWDIVCWDGQGKKQSFLEQLFTYLKISWLWRIKESWFPKGLLAKMGIQWIGPYPWYTIYVYQLRCTTVETDDNMVTRPKPRSEPSKYVFRKKTVYYSLIRCVTKSDELLSFELEYLFDLECLNPWKALFSQDEWFMRITALTDTRAIRLFARMAYGDINAERSNQFVHWMSLYQEILLEETGFRFSNPRIYRKIPGENPQTIRFIKAQSEEEIEKGEGDGRIARAIANAAVVKQEGEGEADYIKKVAIARNAALETGLNNLKAGVEGISNSLAGKDTTNILASVAAAIALQAAQGLLIKPSEANTPPRGGDGS